MEKYFIEDMNYSIVENEVDTYFLQLNGKQFYVGHLVIEILELLKNKTSYSEIAKTLNSKHPSGDFNEENIKSIVENDFVSNGIFSSTDSVSLSNQKYIYFKFRILNLKKSIKLLSLLRILFIPAFFYCILTIGIISTLVFSYFEIKNVEYNIFSHHWSIIAIFLVLYFSTVFWHELGHAASSYYYKVMPKDIGFGFYIIYPVFYTDVTNIWQLNKYQRILVNSAGVYFQLISNLLFISLYIIFPDLTFLRELIFANILLILVSFNPFFKYDGYWVYSDYFSIQNLHKESNRVRDRIISKIIQKKEDDTWSNIGKEKKSLLIYFIGNTLFFIFFIFTMLKFGISQLKLIYIIIKESASAGFNFQQITPLLGAIFFLLISTFFLLKTFILKKHNK